MFATIISVRLLKPIWEARELETADPVMEKLLEGKRALSIVLKSANLPMDLLYLGAKVDVTDIKDGELFYLARNVPLAGLSMTGEGDWAKVTLAVNIQDSETIIKNRTDTLSLMLSNLDANTDIEIVEM